jgi:CheY-like chemotaxis protein
MKSQPFDGDHPEGAKALAFMQGQPIAATCRVLLFEEETVYRERALEALAGCSVTIASRWQDVLHFACTQPFDLIVVAIKRQGEHAIGTMDLRRFMHTHTEQLNLSTPYIGLVEEGSEDRVSEALSAGYLDVVTKPFSSNWLRRILQNHFPQNVSFREGGRAML